MERIVMSSNRLDSHGEVMMKEALEGAAVQINGEKKIPYVMNHKRELPPLGILVDGRTEQQDDLILLTAAPMLFPKREIINIEGVELIKESFEEQFKIISRYDEEITGLSISLDPSNFNSDQELEILTRNIHQIDKAALIEMHGRKSDQPSPELIISIFAGSAVGRFILEKLAEDVLDDFYEMGKKQLKSFAEYAGRVMNLTREKATPKNKRLTTIFEVHSDPFIELAIKSDDPSMISKALNEKKLLVVKTEIQKFMKHFPVDRIQFLLSETGNWKFNYLITKKGEVVGQKPGFVERDRQYKRYEMQSETLASHRLNHKSLFARKKIK